MQMCHYAWLCTKIIWKLAVQWQKVRHCCQYVEMVSTDGLVQAIESDKSEDEDDGSDNRQNVRDNLDHKFDKKYKVHLPDSAIGFWMDYDKSTNIDLNEWHTWQKSLSKGHMEGWEFLCPYMSQQLDL